MLQLLHTIPEFMTSVQPCKKLDIATRAFNNSQILILYILQIRNSKSCFAFQNNTVNVAVA